MQSSSWNLDPLYPNRASWELELSALKNRLKGEILFFQGKLSEGSLIVRHALDTLFSLHTEVMRVYMFAHLRHDQDVTSSERKGDFAKARELLSLYQEHSAFFEPELFILEEAKLDLFLNSEELAPYRHYLTRLLKQKSHRLGKEEEQLLARGKEVLDLPYRAFNALTDGDFFFPDAVDGNGKSRPLTHGSFATLIRDPDAALRKSAFENYHRKYATYQTVLAELLSGQIVRAHFLAKSRSYRSCLEADLAPNDIPIGVYKMLGDTVLERLPSLWAYYTLKKEKLGLEKLGLADLYVPLSKGVEMQFTLEEAIDLTVESVAPLGREYQDILKKGLKEEGWLDTIEEKGKRSGAYSSGCHSSPPYILMNFKGGIRDLFTLAHEAGHSMHSYYSRKEQPPQYSDYTIFVAEVASTFAEQLLFDTLIRRASKKEEIAFLTNQKLEEIRTTLFRQTHFALFEERIHSLVEAGTPLTADILKEEYKELLQRFCGESVHLEEVGLYEWARIPHFYYGHYVYQYATGISAALALFSRLQREGEVFKKRYLQFLSSGSSSYPIELLKSCGVNLESKEPIHLAIDHFDTLRYKLSSLLE